MATPERIEKLQGMWTRLLQDYCVPPADGYPVFDRLEVAYREPHRHYHTFDHLYDVFRVVGRLSPGATDPGAIALAVWFHDVVYDTHREDNEDRSADRLREWLMPLGVPDSTIDVASGLIRATCHREPPRSADEIILIDADLSILGAAEYRYQAYTTGIRQEYGWVSDGDYRAGRTRVLEGFLARDRIYTHPLMIAEGEESARRNLTAELQMLRAP